MSAKVLGISMKGWRAILCSMLLFLLAGCEMGGYSTENPDEFCIKLLAKGREETRDWLRSGPKNTLGEIQTNAESQSFVRSLYELGAPHVFAVEIDKYPGGMENTGRLVIELPSDPELRPGVIKLAAKIAHEQGFDAYSDVGQKYVFVVLD